MIGYLVADDSIFLKQGDLSNRRGCWGEKVASWWEKTDLYDSFVAEPRAGLLCSDSFSAKSQLHGGLASLCQHLRSSSRAAATVTRTPLEDIQMLKTSRCTWHAHARASRPDRASAYHTAAEKSPKFCIRKLTRPPQCSSSYCSQHISFSNPTPQTDHAGHARTLQYCTKIIMLSNQKGYNT